MKTSPEEFMHFINLLPKDIQEEIWLIPLTDKVPDVPKNVSWKLPQYKLTIQQAQNRLREGKNVGIVGHSKLVIMDVDSPDKFIPTKLSLEVSSRSGGYHIFYRNSGEITGNKFLQSEDKQKNVKGKVPNIVELRADNMYVVASGSYVAPDNGNTNLGLYRIRVTRPLETLYLKDLPKKLRPEINKDIVIQPTDIDLKKIEQVCLEDSKLNDLLSNKNCDYPSSSEADFATLSRLVLKGFTKNEAVTILKTYRAREKLNREDYLRNMLNKIDEPSELTKPKKTSQGVAETPDIEKILEYFYDKYYFKTADDTEDIYIYFDGVYVLGEIKIKQELENKLGCLNNSYFVNEVINHIRRKTYVSRTEFNVSKNDIPCLNGILNLKTLELSPFTPERIFTYKINAYYDPTKDCPKFKEFVNQVLDEENGKILQEYMGYCLLPDMPYHKIMFLHGEGRNGKDRIAITVEYILGQENVSHVTLEELNGEQRFSVVRLYGKLANFSSEPMTNKTLNTPLLKKVTGESSIDGEVKNRQKPIKFTNFAKLWVLGNKFPKVKDTTISFWDRLIMIPFEKSFLDSEQIPNIQRRWIDDKDEMSGLLNWLIVGLTRLALNGKFSTNKKMEELKNEFKLLSDPVEAFFNDKCFIDNKLVITRKKLYNDYKEYVDLLGIAPESDRSFYAKVRMIPKVSEGDKKIDNKSVRVFLGIDTEPPDSMSSTNSLDNYKEDVKGVEDKRSQESQESHIFGGAKVDDIGSVISNEYETGATPATSASKNKILCCDECNEEIKENSKFTPDTWSGTYCDKCVKKLLDFDEY